jgi:para-nitrobenzyl esterase
MLYKKVLFFFFILGINSVFSQIVSTQFGPIQGNTNENSYQFLGIPYAKPPVDTPTELLRWKAPQNPTAWTDVKLTTEYAPVCPQKEFQQGSEDFILKGEEDCLYLNIWTPTLSNQNLPVLFFIHGGGNQQGSPSSISGGTETYNGKNMAERGNVVVVSIQYRLGPLGFLVHPGLDDESITGKSGNFAVLDQILALQWVQNNIANFGGNPDNIMIFGESAGGVNVGNLLLTPLANGLFDRACIQSGTPLLSDYTISKLKGINYVNEFVNSGSNAEKIAYMRTLSSDDLVSTESSPLDAGITQLNWQPTVDGIVFTQHPIATIQSGNFNKVPLMVGSNSEEMNISAPPTVTSEMVDALILAYFPLDLQPQAQVLYPNGNGNTSIARESYVGILTDKQFTATSRRTVQCVSLNQTEPVWRYFFTHKHTFPGGTALGSYHGMELLYVFNNFENSTLGQGVLFHDEDENVQNAMLQYWTNFARFGNPNANGLEDWPVYNAENDPFMEIKSLPDGTQVGIRTEKCDLWDESVDFTGCTSSLALEEIKPEEAIRVYPNPTKGLVYIQMPTTEETFMVSVYDVSGKCLGVYQNPPSINLEAYENGIYHIKFTLKDKIFFTQIIR